MEKICSVCGSTMRVIGNQYVCSFCAHKEPINGNRKQDTTWKNTVSSSRTYSQQESKNGNVNTNTVIALAIIGAAIFFICIVFVMIFGLRSTGTKQEQSAYGTTYEKEDIELHEEVQIEDVVDILGGEYGIRSEAMQKAVEAMFQKPYDQVTKEDFQSVKYISVKVQSSWEDTEPCEISYSFADYQEYLSDEVNPEKFGYSEEFADTIQTFVYVDENEEYDLVYRDVCNFTGVTAMYLDDYKIIDLSTFKELRYVDCTERNLRELLACDVLTENIEILKLDREGTLEDLASFTSLKKLYVECYEADSLKDLAQCEQLETLCCINLKNGACIADIGELTNLKSLYLDCVSDEIKDVSRIANLSNLEHLALVNTEILNINFLAGFSGLKSLMLSENDQLQDFSVIGDLVNLESLHFDLNALHGGQPEYQDIGKLKNLKRLSLNTVYELDFLYDLPQLEELEVKLTFYDNVLEPIGKMSNLKRLKLEQCEFRNPDDFAYLKALPQLNSFTLSRADIKNAPDMLFQLNQLEEFRVQNCKFEMAPASVVANDKLKVLDMSFVEFITWPGPESEYYYVGYNDPAIMNYVLSGFSSCTNLEELYLDGCLVTELSFLNQLGALKVLSLERCELTDLDKDTFVGCSMLEELNLKDNTVSNVEFAHCLANLKKLNLENDYVADLTPLLSCEKLEYVNVKENPVYDHPLRDGVVHK